MRIICLLWLYLFSVQSHAFELSPMIQDMTLSTKNNSAQIELKNTSGLEVPFEIQVNEIIFDQSGEYVIKSASDDIIILPPAVILQAGASQILRLQWISDKALSQSKAYYINVSQPPIKTDNSADGVRLALSVNAIVHVVPSDASDTVVVKKVHQHTPSALSLTLINEGNKYAHISDFSIGIYANEKERIHFSQQDIKDLGYDAFLAPGVSKKMDINLPVAIDDVPLDVRLTKE